MERLSINGHRARDTLREKRRPRRPGIPTLSVVERLVVDGEEAKAVNRGIYGALRRKGQGNIKVFRYGQAPLNIADRAAFRRSCSETGKRPQPAKMRELFQELCVGLQNIADKAPNSMSVKIGDLATTYTAHSTVQGKTVPKIAIELAGIQSDREGISLVEHVGQQERFSTVVDAHRLCVDAIEEFAGIDLPPNLVTGDVNIPILGVGPRNPRDTLLAVGGPVKACLPQEGVVLGGFEVAVQDGAGGVFHESILARAA